MTLRFRIHIFEPFRHDMYNFVFIFNHLVITTCYMIALQTLPVMKTFSLCSFSLQGKTCNENRKNSMQEIKSAKLAVSNNIFSIALVHSQTKEEQSVGIVD